MQHTKIPHQNFQLSIYYRNFRKFIPKGLRPWIEQKIIFGISSKAYDFYMSLGENCLPARTLNEVNLRKFSGPFDWIAKSDFGVRVSHVESNFKDVLNYEDLHFDVNTRTDNRHNACSVNNLKTGFWYPHDFQNDSQEEFEKQTVKYQRRQKRLYSLARDTNGLFIYSDIGSGVLYSDYPLKINDFFAGMERLKTKLKMKKISLVLVVKAIPDMDANFVDLYEKDSMNLYVQPIPYFDSAVAADKLFDFHGMFIKRALQVATNP